MLKKDKALCIRAIDYSEASQIITFFTRDNGKITAIAKGAKRSKSSFGGAIEILSFADIIFLQKNKESMSTLTQFDQLSLFAGLRKDLFALNSAFFAAELLNTFTHDFDKGPELFDSIVDFLTEAQNERSKASILALLILFQFTLLSQTGVLPILQFCLNCKSDFNDNWRQSFFSSAANGLLCRDCQGSFPDRIAIAGDVAKCICDLNHIKEAKLQTLEGIERLLIHHFTEISGKRPKMAKFIST